jgi:hypothetical protein
MPKYWPTWLGLITGIAALPVGLLIGSDLQEGWQLATRFTVRALLAMEMPSINPLTDPYTLAGVAALAVRFAAMRRNRATPLDPVNAV